MQSSYTYHTSTLAKHLLQSRKHQPNCPHNTFVTLELGNFAQVVHTGCHQLHHLIIYLPAFIAPLLKLLSCSRDTVLLPSWVRNQQIEAFAHGYAEKLRKNREIHPTVQVLG